MANYYFEAVEMCAFCESENTYPMHNVDVDGYVVICKYCGQQIMLCDECQHSEDNPNRHCDWCATECGGRCFRGNTIEIKE